MQGLSIIAGHLGKQGGATFCGNNPVTGEALEPAFHSASMEELDKACEAAWNSFDAYRNLSAAKRATFLRCIADQIEASETLVARGMQETGLPEARLQGERGRTCNQLRLFATLIETGNWVEARIEHAQPDRKPIPKADLRSMRRPLGPVAVFCASNFPLAYSVAGGDTASALASGCPVIVKAHHAHPGVAQIIGEAVVAAMKQCEIPEGVFSLIYGPGRTIGQALVKNPRIKAVGFTGSRAGGRALMDIAAVRPEPIPVYAEMSSINPVVILPNALKTRGPAIAKGLHVSVTMGVGQFCTNPGLIVMPAGTEADQFCKELSAMIEETPSCPMLHHGIREAYSEGLGRKAKHAAVEQLATSDSNVESGSNQAGAVLFRTTAAAYLQDEQLAEEVFGPSTLIVTYEIPEELSQLANSLEGQLTATIHGEADDFQSLGKTLNTLETKAGRLVFNGYPTGVEVCHAIVHGGPYPATSDGRSTSVGTPAIERFTRLVAWQDCPEALLPEELQDGNPLSIQRLVDGKFE